MATKLTITVPDDLAKRLEPHREHMNISRVCAEALEAELKSRETHLESLARYEEFKRMRGEVEALREQMAAQAGRGWQKVAQDMQRTLKDIGHEIEQLEKQIPEGLRAETAPEAELPEPAHAVEAEAASPEPEPAAQKPAPSPESKPTLTKVLRPRRPEASAASS